MGNFGLLIAAALRFSDPESALLMNRDIAGVYAYSAACTTTLVRRNPCRTDHGCSGLPSHPGRGGGGGGVSPAAPASGAAAGGAPRGNARRRADLRRRSPAPTCTAHSRIAADEAAAGAAWRRGGSSGVGNRRRARGRGCSTVRCLVRSPAPGAGRQQPRASGAGRRRQSAAADIPSVAAGERLENGQQRAPPCTSQSTDDGAVLYRDGGPACLGSRSTEVLPLATALLWKLRLRACRHAVSVAAVQAARRTSSRSSSLGSSRAVLNRSLSRSRSFSSKPLTRSPPNPPPTRCCFCFRPPPPPPLCLACTAITSHTFRSMWFLHWLNLCQSSTPQDLGSSSASSVAFPFCCRHVQSSLVSRATCRSRGA